MKHSVFIAALLALTLNAYSDAAPSATDVTPPATTGAAPPAAEAAPPAAGAAPPAAGAAPPAAGAAPPAAGATAPAADGAPPAAGATAPAADGAPPAAGAAPPAAGAAPAAAMDVEAGSALAKKSGCFACHHLDQKRVGPSWKDVSEKYKADPAAKDTLVQWIHKGGTGRWNMGVMPAYSPRVSDENINALADFVLSLKK